MKQLRVLALVFSLCAGVAGAETVSIVIASNAAPRVQFGAEKHEGSLDLKLLFGNYFDLT